VGLPPLLAPEPIAGWHAARSRRVSSRRPARPHRLPWHPETIELSDIEFRCSMSGARFNVISSRRSPLHKFVIQKIEKAAPEATRSPAAEPPSATHQPAIEAVAPSLTLPAPRVGRWLARIVGRKAEVIPSMPSASAPKEPTAGMTAPVATYNIGEYNWSGFSCPYCSASSFVACPGDQRKIILLVFRFSGFSYSLGH
jgi:hypothetical protein